MYTLEDIIKFRETYGIKKLILDTNLLLLLLIGSYKIESLIKCKCTQKYICDDYDLLLKIITYFERKIIITPHILAEFSNLSRRDIRDPQVGEYITCVVEKLKEYHEQHISMVELLKSDTVLLARFGFPDVGIIEAAKELDAFILTDDGNLSRYANDCKIPNCFFQYIKNNAFL